MILTIVLVTALWVLMFGVVDPGTASLIVGGLGLGGSKKAQNAAASAQRRALEEARLDAKYPRLAKEKLYGMAEAANPDADVALAKSESEAAATESLSRAMREVTASSSLAGGVPGRSSAINVSAQKALGDVLGPFAAAIAALRQNAVQRKANMYGMVMGSPPGQLSDTYLKVAQMQPVGNPMGSLGLLGQGLDMMLGGPRTNQSLPSLNDSVVPRGFVPGTGFAQSSVGSHVVTTDLSGNQTWGPPLDG